jgi:hypothetical protein
MSRLLFLPLCTLITYFHCTDTTGFININEQGGRGQSDLAEWKERMDLFSICFCLTISIIFLLAA